MSIVIVNFRAVIEQMESRDHEIAFASLQRNLQCCPDGAWYEIAYICRHKENKGIYIPDHHNLS